jgi:hypothetical protein
MKSVPNSISYLHEFSWNFHNSKLFILSYFRPGVNFNSETADMRGPPVSHRFPHRAHLSVRSLRVAATRRARMCRAIKAPADHTDAPIVDRRLTSRTIDRRCLKPRPAICSRPRVSDSPCHRRRSAAPAASPPVVAESRVPERRPRLAVYATVYPIWMPPSPSPPGKPWCRRLRHAFVPSACRCLHRELSRATVHALVRPRHAFPHTASHAPVKSPLQSTRATPPRALRRVCLRQPVLGQAVGHARCAGRGRAGSGWATCALHRPATPVLCNWAAADLAQ